MPLLDVRDLTIRSRAATLVERVSFAVEAGERVGISGASG